MITAPASSRLLFRWALVLFTITVVIGIPNGSDLVSFDRNADLTHFHSGTLGWVTLSLLGAMLWIFDPDGADRSGGRGLAILSTVAIVFYIVGFWTGDPFLRPLAGSAALIPIVGGVAWAVRRSGGATRDVPKRGILLSLTSLALGGVLGIQLGLQRTNVVDWLRAGLSEAHPQLLFGGYVFLAGGVLAEWLLVGDDDPKRQDRSGQVQVWLFFLAGLSLGIGLILDVSILALLPVPAGVAGFGLILTRMRSGIRHTRWTRPSESRFPPPGSSGWWRATYFSATCSPAIPTHRFRPGRAVPSPTPSWSAA